MKQNRMMLCMRQIDETKSNDVMYAFAQTNWRNKIEQCYACICAKQIDETK
jgi:hypothetical protein